MKKTLPLKTLPFLSVIALAPWCLRAQSLPFMPLDTNYQGVTITIPPSPLNYDVLYSGNADFVYINNGTDSAAGKQNNDFTAYIPLNPAAPSDSGWLFINQEITNTKNEKLGDGGGMTFFKVKKTGSGWETVPSIGGQKHHNVDFSLVGLTNTNCGGAVTADGRILTGEEYPQASNVSIYNSGNGFSDTSDFIIPTGNGVYSGKSLKRYLNFGWMVAVDPTTGKAANKIYGMGRFSHEGGHCMADHKTVYLTEDNTPGHFYKYVADQADDFTAGQLYAFREGQEGSGGTWIPLPMELDSLVNASNIASRMGATGYTRLEWVVEGNGKLYITETGLDNSNYKNLWTAENGSTPSYHHLMLDTLGGQPADSSWNDYYGRVLEFDPITQIMRPFIDGGFSTDGETNFSNPDGLAVTTQNEKTWLVMNEDLNGNDFGRSPGNLNACEVFYLDLSILNPTVDDLHRFLIGAAGGETTGGVFTPDGSTYFVNIQHPASTNPPPFNNSTTIAVSGFEHPTGVDEVTDTTDKLVIYPNPATRTLFFSHPADIAIYTVSGQRVLVRRQVKSLDISEFSKGIYFIQSTSGEVHKVVIQ